MDGFVVWVESTTLSRSIVQYRWIWPLCEVIHFIGLTLVFLGLAFRKLYLVPQVCTPGSCADSRTIKRQRLIFWVVAVLMLGLLAVPVLAPLFY